MDTDSVMLIDKKILLLQHLKNCLNIENRNAYTDLCNAIKEYHGTLRIQTQVNITVEIEFFPSSKDDLISAKICQFDVVDVTNNKDYQAKDYFLKKYKDALIGDVISKVKSFPNIDERFSNYNGPKFSLIFPIAVITPDTIKVIPPTVNNIWKPNISSVCEQKEKI